MFDRIFYIEDGQNNCSNSLIYWAPDLTGLINNKLSHKESYNRKKSREPYRQRMYGPWHGCVYAEPVFVNV
jgi:hypothetical protein